MSPIIILEPGIEGRSLINDDGMLPDNIKRKRPCQQA
jgi:hypothetical protein